MTTDAALLLRDVDDDVLGQLISAASCDADPDEVTPRVGPEGGWSAARIEWLREFHVNRRAGLDGPLREATWAVVVNGAIVGSARLARSSDPGTAETGLWLTRTARGCGVGRRVLVEVLAVAAKHDLNFVEAITRPGNHAALRVLSALGFEVRASADEHTVTTRREVVR